MALISSRSIVLSGESRIGDVTAESYQATIDSNNPENMGISRWAQDPKIYKENRVQCRKDSAEFEELAYTLQEELMAALQK